MFHYLLSVCPVLDTPDTRSRRDSCGALRVGGPRVSHRRPAVGREGCSQRLLFMCPRPAPQSKMTVAFWARSHGGGYALLGISSLQELILRKSSSAPKSLQGCWYSAVHHNRKLEAT